MTTGPAPWLAEAAALVARLRATAPTLPVAPGAILPRLVGYTREDKAAKGLRSLRDRHAATENPIHFTAAEMLQETRALLLVAPSGGGKTTLARDLALRFAAALPDAPDAGGGPGAAAPIRNPRGDSAAETWALGPTLPALQDAVPGLTAAAALDAAGPGFAAALHDDTAPVPLLILDAVERLGADGPDIVAGLMALAAAHPRLRLLLLGDADAVGGWRLPADMARHALLPLPAPERQRALAAAGHTARAAAALAPAAAHPGFFALARDLDGLAADATADAILDAWLAQAPIPARQAARARPFLAAGLDAADIARAADPARAVALFARDPAAAAPVIASVLARWRRADALRAALIRALLDLPGDAGRRAALCVGEAVAGFPGLTQRLEAALAEIVEAGALRPLERIAAGAALARRGDRRDLEAMVDVPAGWVTMGCASNPNSAPLHRLPLAGFRIGAYPVTNARYAAFVAATGRAWLSTDGHLPERANRPATDLTWHDARAFCAWLTPLWRRAGRIAPDTMLRLPTEPEWERAARGDRPAPPTGFVHPWGETWDDDRVNGETTGLNDSCAVGLFPRGRSPWGCDDMAGQVWEWCSTLWGEDMARPDFAYPWRDDGREARDAPDHVRRVLRGGCFSSGPAKANVAYRGSLEANGFWRGNGFRIVASRRGAA